MVVMVAQGNAEYFLGLVLLDHVSVEVGLDVLGAVIEGFQVIDAALNRFFTLCGWGVARGSGGESRKLKAAKMFLHELGELFLKLLRAG